MVLRNLLAVPPAYAKLYRYAKHTDEYPEEEKYRHIQYILKRAVRTGNINLQITGQENIPAEGGFIICANHIHWNDCLYLAAKIRPRRITYIAKAEVFANKLFSLVLGEKGLGAIPIHRGEADLTAMRAALKVVADGDALGIFPQGTRSRDNTPTPMLNGVSMIALRAKAPIIPVYIDGPYRLFKRIDVRIGAPVDISDLGRRPDAATMNAITDRIATAIWCQQG